MEFLKLALTFGVGYLIILIGDAIFLGRVIHQYIIDSFGSLISTSGDSIDMNLPAGVFAWLAITAMVFIFVNQSGYATSSLTAFGFGALMGFIMYSMYDLTNLTFLRDYPVGFVMIDIAWGTVLCGTMALGMYLFGNWINTVL